MDFFFSEGRRRELTADWQERKSYLFRLPPLSEANFLFLLLKESAVFKTQTASAKGRTSICISSIYMFAGKLISQLQRARECGIGKTTSFSHIHFSLEMRRGGLSSSSSSSSLTPFPKLKASPPNIPCHHPSFTPPPPPSSFLSRETSMPSSSAKGRGGKREIWRWHVFASPSSPSHSFSNPNPRLYSSSSSSSSSSSFPVTLRPCHRQSHKKGEGNGQGNFWKK